jgi:hypothetical protein
MNSLSQQRLGLPSVASDGFGFSVAAGSASFLAHMVGASSASSAHDVDDFALTLAH